MEATLTLHQAGIQLGVEDTVLSRLIRIGALPEAKKVNRPDGVVWVIPAQDLSKVASRNGWTIDLRAETVSAGAAADTVLGNGVHTNPAEPEVAPVETAADGSDSSPAESDRTVEIDKSNPIPAELNQSTAVNGNGDAKAGALIPRTNATPAVAESTEDSVNAVDKVDGAPSMAEAIDLALLDRLLGVQEERVAAQVEAREAKHALAALNATHDRATGELEIERRERMVTSDRFREERMARAVADAKIAELRDRVVREMSLADAEKQARSEALARSIRAERDAANAVASMGWRARRRYRKLSQPSEE